VTARLRFAEAALAAYAAVVTVTALARTPERPGNALVAVGHALVLLLVWLMTRPGLGPAGRRLRDIAPIVLLLGLYASLDVLNGAGHRATWDDVLLHWEARLFGLQPARDWWRLAPSRGWSTLLHAVYLSYYFLVAVPALVLLARRDPAGIRRFVQYVIPTFLACYVFFVFLPVAGPYYVFPRPDAWFTDNAPARMVYASLARGSSFGAAFPSSHVAATVAAFLATWRECRPLALAILAPVLLMPVATVYCQMHYALDAIFGVVFGLLVPALAVQAGRRLGDDPAA
jgi:membrane-associated phospholipid phosphatase